MKTPTYTPTLGDYVHVSKTDNQLVTIHSKTPPEKMSLVKTLIIEGRQIPVKHYKPAFKSQYFQDQYFYMFNFNPKDKH